LGSLASLNLRRAVQSDIPVLAALQRAAYADLKARVGTSLQPVDADFDAVFQNMEIWLAGEGDRLDAALILDRQPGYLIVWSIAVAPDCRGAGLGTALLDFAESNAVKAGLSEVRLFTNELFTENIAWYRRRGYQVARIDQRSDRRIVHFTKVL
jgi:ribosomal protein S18 acetylase RimI-like enzyme